MKDTIAIVTLNFLGEEKKVQFNLTHPSPEAMTLQTYTNVLIENKVPFKLHYED